MAAGFNGELNTPPWQIHDSSWRGSPGPGGSVVAGQVCPFYHHRIAVTGELSVADRRVASYYFTAPQSSHKIYPFSLHMIYKCSFLRVA